MRRTATELVILAVAFLGSLVALSTVTVVAGQEAAGSVQLDAITAVLGGALAGATIPRTRPDK